MRKAYIRYLLSLASKKRSSRFKALALIECGLVFLILIPWFLIWAGEIVSGWISLTWPSFLEISLGLAALAAGILWLGWSVWTQVAIGEGTPNFAAPTTRLIVKGPYRLCRNPIQLATMLYYLGLGTVVADMTVGLIALAVSSIAGSLYHRYVEEKELRARFGEEYEAYRKKTPFLIPRLK